MAIGLTAVVHLANNLFKLALVGKFANAGVVLRFGIPAFLAALLGAWVLLRLAHLPPLAAYHFLGRTFQIAPVKLVVAVLMVVFALVEVHPALAALTLPPGLLSLGGVLSGFFGGLSGHQGALRSIFLLKCGLTKEGFISTGVVIACLVDISRLAVYAEGFPRRLILENASAPPGSRDCRPIGVGPGAAPAHQGNHELCPDHRGHAPGPGGPGPGQRPDLGLKHRDPFSPLTGNLSFRPTSVKIQVP